MIGQIYARALEELHQVAEVHRQPIGDGPPETREELILPQADVADLVGPIEVDEELVADDPRQLEGERNRGTDEKAAPPGEEPLS